MGGVYMLVKIVAKIAVTGSGLWGDLNREVNQARFAMDNVCRRFDLSYDCYPLTVASLDGFVVVSKQVPVDGLVGSIDDLGVECQRLGLSLD